MTNVATLADVALRTRVSAPTKKESHFASLGTGPSHTVLFHEDEEVLGARVGGFLADGLAAGEPVIVIATQPHRDTFRRHLLQQAFDVAAAESTGQLVWLDAAETLAQLMVGRIPDAGRFQQVIGGAVHQLTCGQRGTRFRAYGEMVDLLCHQGETDGALRLEELWNGLSTTHSFALLCGYAMDRFAKAGDTAAFEHVCNSHTHVFDAADDRQVGDFEATQRELVSLRQRARALESEVEYRKRLEKEVRRSKRELEEFCENAAEGIHRVSAEGVILWANAAELELLGYSREEYIGHHIAEFHVDQDKIEDILARLTRNETLINYEARLRCKDGSVKHVVISSNVLREEGKFLHTRCFTRDITERKRAEVAVRFLAEASAVIASSLDYESTLATVCRMCVPSLADWATVDLVLDGMTKRVAVSSVPDAGSLDAPRELGLGSTMCVPLWAGEATIGAITFVAAESGRRFDANDLALAEELARRASTAIQHARLYRDAQTAARMKDEFLATVSHELRTPLNAILGWARMLRTGSVGPDKVDRALDAIERNSLSQAQLIEDLLDVSRIVSGKLRLDVQPLRLSPVVEAAIDSIQHAIQAKSVQFQHIVDPDAGPISGDPQRIQQVIWNLLSNAVKFTPKGGSVRLIVQRVDSNIQLVVSDTGQGIPKHLLPFVFERFKQADGSTARVHGGLGLGLAIARHIVELHGGTIRAHSEGEGRGAAFTVSLPVSPLRRGSAGPFRHPVHSDLKPQFEQPKELQGLTVLVIDDEADSRELLAEVLEQCGSLVLTASSAAEGLAVLDRASPRVVVCDIGMPGADGYEFIQKVRERAPEKGGRVVAVALTAYASPEDRRRALRSGFQMHLGKPVEPAEFVAVLANLAQLAIAMA